MNNKTNLVLSGGGIKGVTHIGALYALEKLDILQHITHFAGTSVGSLIIGLYAVGYTPLELFEFSKAFDFKEMKCIDINNIQNYGLDDCSKIQYVIKRLIMNKKIAENITLQVLYDITKKHLTFTTVCVNTMKSCYISHETHPQLELVTAIQMSLAIPLIFCPVIYENNMYIDGGCLDNFPISVFKDNMENTIGLIIIDSNERIDINDLETYFIRVFKCIANGVSGAYSHKLHEKCEKCTIEIDASIINSIDFDINDTTKDELFLIGYDTVLNNLDKLV
jgi:NTE family protein